MIRHPTDCQYDLGIGPTEEGERGRNRNISHDVCDRQWRGSYLLSKKKSKTTKIFTKEVKFYAIIYYLAKPWFALEVAGVQTGAH